MKKIIVIFIGLCTLALNGFAQSFENFDVKENLLKNSKLAIIACDTANHPIENVNGNYTFIANGFEQQLHFAQGIAVLPLPIEKSTFVFLKHINEAGTHAKLFYIYKNEEGLHPYKINIFWLIAIPCLIILIISAMKKYIYIGIALLIIYLYLGHSQGLGLGTFFDSLFTQLKSWIP